MPDTNFVVTVIRRGELSTEDITVAGDRIETSSGELRIFDFHQNLIAAFAEGVWLWVL
jgi:hypothetical protein